MEKWILKGGPRNYSYTNNSQITISDNWLRMSAVIHNV